MYENNYPNGAYRYETENMGSSMNQGNVTRQGNGKKNGGGTGKKIAVAICCGLCFGIFGGMGFWAVNTAGNFLNERIGSAHIQQIGEEPDEREEEESGIAEEETAQEEKQEEDIEQTQQISAVVTDVTAVVKEVMPAVVSINNKYVEKMSFFGQEYSSEAQSTGSGIIVGQNDTELLLVSNYHVVAAAEELTVQFVDGEQVQAQIKGTDADKDLAVIAVQLSDISSDTRDEIAIAKLGDSDSLTVGEPAIAIGNALGYGQSVTTGVVSALNRAIPNSTSQGYDYDVSATDMEINTFIQTDAAINPGNSGGALLNMKGEVIGINSNKIGATVVEGIGYAIPISDAKPIIENLMSKETRLRVEEGKRGYLGITGVDVRSDYSADYGVPQGVYISSVMEGSAADAAGLIRGNIITGINGEQIESMSELKEELSYYAAGDTVELTVMAILADLGNYEEKTVSVTLGAQNRQ